MTTSNSEGQVPEQGKNESMKTTKTQAAQEVESTTGQAQSQTHEPDAEQDNQSSLDAEGERIRAAIIEAEKDEVSKIEESAKQLVGITSGLQALYIAIFAFSNIHQQVEGIVAPFLLKIVLFLLYFSPLLLWLVSLYFAMRVFFTPIGSLPYYRYNITRMSEVLREINERTIQRRKKALQWLYRSLIVVLCSSAIVLILFGIFIFLLPTPASPPTQIQIVNPTPTPTP